MALPRNTSLLPNARTLRREMTREEKHLWYDFLRNYPVKIYRQRIVGNYILDFYCNAAAIAIELDGSQHYSEDGKIADERRTKWLNEFGIKVIRFSNLDVNKHFEGVCTVIDREIQLRVHPKASP